MTTVAVPGRALLLVAGMPGAGKSTLLGALPARAGLRVLDSDTYRARLRVVLGRLPYRRYRVLVHLWHRLDVLFAAISPTEVVVVHMPATRPGTRRAVAVLARLTGRSAHLVWLHVDPEQALHGQRTRGRLVPGKSFAEHARRAAETTVELRRDGAPGWATVTVLDRTTARHGLAVETPAATAA